MCMPAGLPVHFACHPLKATDLAGATSRPSPSFSRSALLAFLFIIQPTNPPYLNLNLNQPNPTHPSGLSTRKRLSHRHRTRSESIIQDMSSRGGKLAPEVNRCVLNQAQFPLHFLARLSYAAMSVVLRPWNLAVRPRPCLPIRSASNFLHSIASRFYLLFLFRSGLHVCELSVLTMTL